jgi:hypothetical protein
MALCFIGRFNTVPFVQLGSNEDGKFAMNSRLTYIGLSLLVFNWPCSAAFMFQIVEG